MVSRFYIKLQSITDFLATGTLNVPIGPTREININPIYIGQLNMQKKV